MVASGFKDGTPLLGETVTLFIAARFFRDGHLKNSFLDKTIEERYPEVLPIA
jgi:hypothetical protein